MPTKIRELNEITFGVENEFYVPSDVIGELDGYHNRETHCDDCYDEDCDDCPWDGDGQMCGFRGTYGPWTAKDDCSINPTSGNSSIEINSPVMKGVSGISDVVKAFTYIKKDFNAGVNNSCGLHVHVGCPGDDIFGQLKRTLFYASNYEDGIYGLSGSTHRKFGTGYCSPVKPQLKRSGFPDAKNTTDLREKTQRRNHDWLWHRNGFNISNLLGWNDGVKRTFEFRYFPATTDRLNAALFTQIALAIVQKAEKAPRCPKSDYSPRSGATSNRNKNYYYNETRRLLKAIGWLPGSFADNPLGYFKSADNPYSLKKLVRRALQNARKFDRDVVRRGLN